MGFTRPPKAQVIYATNLQTISIQKLADLLKSVKKEKPQLSSGQFSKQRG
jgi:hypothetical protein